MSEVVSIVVAELKKTDYSELFERLEANRLEAIRARPGWKDALVAVARDAAQEPKVRFLAAELAWGHVQGFPDKSTGEALVAPYGWALKNSISGNRWGTPWGSPGQAGDHLVAIGSPMLTTLERAMHNHALMPIGGSIEATMAELEELRVSDVAHWLASRILKEPYEWKSKPGDRDGKLGELRSRLAVGRR